MYHSIYPAEELSAVPRSATMYHISEANFLQHLTVIKNSNRSIFTASDFNNYKDDSVVITFDDGWKGAFELALPLLLEFGFKATFFVTKDFVGGKDFCDRELLLAAARAGMEIGVHGTSHRMLSSCSREGVMQEFASCKSFLEDLIGIQVLSASMPGGDWNEVIASSAKEIGLEKLFVSKPGINRSKDSLFNLKRIAIRKTTGITDLQRFCDFNVRRELLRDTALQFPRRMLGMKRYSILRRWLLGEKPGNINEVFEP